MRQTIETDKDQLVICRTGENQDPSIHWYKYKEEKPIENSKKNIISHPILRRDRSVFPYAFNDNNKINSM